MSVKSVGVIASSLQSVGSTMSLGSAFCAERVMCAIPD